ncbi:MAG: DNRLRE domain-containing protein [Candidatus Zixiibacteriota bacterium]
MHRKKLFISTLIAILWIVILTGLVRADEVTIKITKAAVVKPDTLSFPNKILLKFDLPSVLEGSRIDYAKLRFKSDFDSTLKYMGIMVHPVTSDWIANSVLSDQDVTYNRAKLSFMSVKQETLEADLDITRMVKAWVKGSLPNKGIILRSMDKPDEAFNITPLDPDMKAEVQIFYTRPEVKK